MAARKLSLRGIAVSSKLNTFQTEVNMKQRRTSVKDRLRTTKDVESWVTANQPVPSSPDHSRRHVRIVEPRRLSVSTESTDSMPDAPVPEEGGHSYYGWWIVAASFFLHFVLDGTTFSFGLVFHGILEKFKAHRVGASTVASVFMSAPLLLSPIAATVTDVLGCRRTIMLGGAISLFGSLLSFFAFNYWMFLVCFGLIVGSGMALLYNAAIVMVTLYFKIRLGLATSIAISGTGVGTAAFPTIIDLVTESLGVELTSAVIILLMGMMVVVIGVGFIIRDVTWISDTVPFKEKMFMKRVEEYSRNAQQNADDINEISEFGIRRAYSLPVLLNIAEPVRGPLDIGSSLQSIKDSVNKQPDGPARSRSEQAFRHRQFLPPVREYTMVTADDYPPLKHLDLQISSSPCNTVHSNKRNIRDRFHSKTSMSVDCITELEDGTPFKISLSNSESESNIDSETESDSEMSNDGDSSSSDLSDRCFVKSKENGVNGANGTNGTHVTNGNGITNGIALMEKGNINDLLPLSARARPSIVPGGMSAMTPGRVPAGNAMRARVHQTNLIALQGKMPSAPDLKHKKIKWYLKNPSIKQAIDVVIAFKNEFPVYKICLANIMFSLFVMSASFLYVVLDVPYVFFYDHSVENLQVEPSSARKLVSVIGIFNLISTWTVGAVADIPFFKRNMFAMYGLFMLATSLAMAGSAMAVDFLGMAVVSAVFGFFISANYALQSVLVHEMFPETNLFISGYAFISFCEGIASLIGPPLMGYIRDTTGSYSSVFYLSCVMVMISSALSFVIHWMMLQKRNKKRASILRESSADYPLLYADEP